MRMARWILCSHDPKKGKRKSTSGLLKCHLCFSIVRSVKKTSWNQAKTQTLSLLFLLLNFPQPVVRLVDRYDSNTKAKGDYNHEMNLAVLPEIFSTRVVTFVVTVFFGPLPSSKVIAVAVASGHSFAASCRLFWRFCCWSITISSFQHYAGQGKNEHQDHEGQR